MLDLISILIKEENEKLGHLTEPRKHKSPLKQMEKSFELFIFL